MEHDMREVARTTVGGRHSSENHSITVTHETGDYTTPDGFHHVDGVHRIRAFYTLSGRAYQGKAYSGRAKTFRGETAWMKAEALFDDIVWEIQRAERY